MKTFYKSILAMLGMGMMSASVMAATSEATTQATPATVTTTASTATTGVEAGKAFLENNAKQPGVVTLADGLQYKILVEGKGKKPSVSDMVVVNYAGRLINGTEFDSSYKNGQPVTFPVNAVIPGWVEALQLMPVGSTWELYIPSHLAYGAVGAPPIIGPNETLIFKVELLDIK